MTFEVYRFDQLDTQLLYDILAHRFEVFVLGRRDIYRDFDYFDQKALHMVARDEDGVIQGYVRLLPSALHYDGYAENAFGRLSVKETARNNGLGSELVRRACDYLIANDDCKAVRISAMAYLENFYSKLGFVRTSDLFDIQGVPHVTMLYKTLSGVSAQNE
jgi:ElaA protein